MNPLGVLLWPRAMGLLNRWRRATRGERSTILFFAFSGLVFWLGMFGGVGWLVQMFHDVEVFGPILTRKLLELLLLSLFGLLMFSNVVTALSTFYLAEDLELVLSLPVQRPVLHAARLLDTIGQSSWMVAIFGMPVFVVYGLVYHAGPIYYLATVVVIAAFVAIPASIGVGVASVLVSTFPARRIRELLAIVGILAVVLLFVALRVVRPERLLDAENFENLAAYVAELQTPVPILTPPRWAADVLLALLQDRPFPWMEFGLLMTGAAATTAIGRWVTSALYDQGRARAQEARAARLARSGLLDRVIAAWTRPLPETGRAIVEKDAKTFVRDPAQWSQLFLLGAIVIITLVSVGALPTDLLRGPWGGVWRNVLGYLLLGLIGFIMAAVAARFQLPAVSVEGRAFWIIRTSPVDPERFLWAKVWPGLVPMLVIGETLAVASMTILEAGPFLMGVAVWTAFILAFGISGVAVGLGALYPDFRLDNAARAAAGPTGLLFMVASLSLVALVILVEAFPVYLFLTSMVRERELHALDWAGVLLPLLAAAGICLAATLIPIRRGARVLWEREHI